MSTIINAPDPVLSQISKPYVFKKSDRFLPGLLKDMEKALLSATDPKGVGLAAPQVGKPIAIFMARPTEKSKIYVFINPRIIDSESNQKQKVRSKKLRKLEGCL